ncbi:response regulator transcription factor [Paenibacillus hamazuiensis]|uniref:response regulator transcription factor n=1 Tax=Paenibacillus hamazuiensis TaxID=2936508 RepID=UPI00200DFCD5|nr:response regulator [Paenibacillus hamazuiensis]
MFHLLLVDDEASVVDSLGDTLPWQEIGIAQVFKAYSGYEALDILKTNSIDIMITDIRMPGISGLQLLEKVRKNWRHIKCILLSGYAEFSYAREAIHLNTADYLLKPIGDNEIMSKVRGVVEQLQTEHEQDKTYRNAMKAFREHLPGIQGDLLNELLQGRRYSASRLQEKLDLLSIPAALSEPFACMLVRLEGAFTEMDTSSLSLMEYAVGNMAEELFAGKFRLWKCKDVHDYLVFLVTASERDGDPADSGEGNLPDQFHLAASRLQNSIKHYLKGTASVLVSPWGKFPEDVHELYQGMLSSLRKQIGTSSELFIAVSGDKEAASVPSLQTLYEPPTFIHLLEAGDWEAIREKLETLFEELIGKKADSPEYLTEMYFGMYSAISSFAHKNGLRLEEAVGAKLADAGGFMPARSSHELKKWAFQSFEMLRTFLDNEMKSNRETMINRIQTYVQKHLMEDVSLQAIADSMYMHPVHVSRVYKLETGENLSDYVLRLKMDKAAALLKSGSLKNYEIALQLGYQNPNYFNKVFKKYYALTPQEFRLKHMEGN